MFRSIGKALGLQPSYNYQPIYQGYVSVDREPFHPSLGDLNAKGVLQRSQIFDTELAIKKSFDFSNLLVIIFPEE